MANTTTTVSFPSAVPVGITMPCPCCGEPDASISVQLADLDGEAFFCRECEGTFTFEFMQTVIKKWSAVMTWVASVPKFDE